MENKPEDNNTTKQEKKDEKLYPNGKLYAAVPLPHGGYIPYYDFPGGVPVAYTIILHERERRLRSPREEITPAVPHFP